MMLPGELADDVARIGADRVSGATAIVLQGLHVLREAAEDRELAARVAIALCAAQPSMAGFRTAAALVLAARELRGGIDRLAERIRRAPAAIEKLAVPLLRLRPGSTGVIRVVTCSRSETV